MITGQGNWQPHHDPLHNPEDYRRFTDELAKRLPKREPAKLTVDLWTLSSQALCEVSVDLRSRGHAEGVAKVDAHLARRTPPAAFLSFETG
jgi:hypothetical protein